MALVLMEGFDLLTTTQTIAKYPLSQDFSAAMVAGRFAPGQGFRPGPNNQNGYFATSFTGMAAMSVGLGLSFPVSRCGAGFSALRFLTSTDARQCGVGFKDDGSVIIAGGASGTTILATSAPGLVSSLVWFYIEVELVLHDTTGRISVFVNGAKVVEVTGADTKGQASAVVERLQVTASGTNLGVSEGFSMDDLYITNTATRLGESRIHVLTPTGDDTAQWTRSAGATNASCVDEAPTNTTDYVASSTVGHQDLYTLSDLPYSPGTIHAVQTRMFAVKDDAATRTIRANLKSGATTANGSDFGLSASYAQKVDLYELDPNGNVPWTTDAVNALLSGPEVRV